MRGNDVRLSLETYGETGGKQNESYHVLCVYRLFYVY
jgi:hypothetical protein